MFSILLLFSLSGGLEQFYSFPSAVYYFLGFLEGIYSFPPIFYLLFLNFLKKCIHFFFSELNHLHKAVFQVFFLCFGYVGLFRAWCRRIDVLWWWYVALAVVDFVHIMNVGIWVYGDYRSRYRFLNLSLLDECFVPWFLFSLWSCGSCSLWLSREGGGSSSTLDLTSGIWIALLSRRQSLSLGLGQGEEEWWSNCRYGRGTEKLCGEAHCHVAYLETSGYKFGLMVTGTWYTSSTLTNISRHFSLCLLVRIIQDHGNKVVDGETNAAPAQA